MSVTRLMQSLTQQLIDLSNRISSTYLKLFFVVSVYVWLPERSHLSTSRSRSQYR